MHHNMKRFNIFSLLAGCFLLASCADESGQTGRKVTDGIPVTATLSFQASGANSVTKATAAEENAVNDLYVLLFEEDGTFSTAQYFTGSELAEFGYPKVKVRTFSGTKKIYAAANVTGNSFTSSGTHLKDRIDEFVKSDNNTLNDWKAFSATLNGDGTVQFGEARFLMTGFFSNNPGTGDQLMDRSEDGNCVIGEDGNVDLTATPGKIQLIRTVSKFKFNISIDESSAKVTSFEPTSWRVVKAPKSVYLYKQPNAGTPTNDFFENLSQGVSNNQFEFYLLENRQDAKETPPGNFETTYEEADWRETTGNYPDNGTYIELKGEFNGIADNPFTEENNLVPVTATVTYKIHLGYINGVNDFDVLRNYNYTYNIKVAGIDRIIVEADNGDETPRADGDAFFYEAGEVIELDAHYSRIEMEFDSGTNLTWAIQTAETGFGYTYQDAVKDGQADWVLFIDKTANNAERPNFTVDRSTQGLMNIRELADWFEDNNTITEPKKFYAYVEENYYKDEKKIPLDQFINYNATDGEAKSRMMMISIERKTSTEGSSAVSAAKYIIRQKPILSFYNMANANVRSQKTFGMEWTNENLPLNYASMSFKDKAEKGGLLYDNSNSVDADKSEKKDGRKNQREKLGSNINTRIKWDNPHIAMYKSDMSTAQAYAACMSRNRDENGDGTIQDDEIKWYLPAIDQYQTIWIGMEAIPDAATLYPQEFRNAKEWQFYHYGSSDRRTFWSEEGNATSGYGLNNGRSTVGRSHIRCARNLGPADKVNTDGAPIDIAIKTDEGDYIILNIADRLTAASLRDGVNSTLTRHNEYGGSELGQSGSNNRLYKELWVQKNPIQSSTNTWVGLMNLAYTNNPCSRFGDGWRVPNQRELILMTTVGGLTSGGYLFAGTYFSFVDIPNNKPLQKDPTGANNTRMGFAYASSNGNFNLGTNSDLSVRCVKDAM